jgi:hypothetical protein
MAYSKLIFRKAQTQGKSILTISIRKADQVCSMALRIKELKTSYRTEYRKIVKNIGNTDRHDIHIACFYNYLENINGNVHDSDVFL